MTSKAPQRKLILASSSIYRRALLDKLQLDYHCQSPDIDETPLPNESAETLVARLAIAKAQAIAKNEADSLVIGSDQVAVLGNTILTKPHTHERATIQLQQCSGKSVSFLTGLCLFDSLSGQYQHCVEKFEVRFLKLTDSQIENYLRMEQPYDCAGSFKSEGLGITLFESMKGKDPNSLIGLPLITLCEMLRKQGLEPLSQ